MADSKNNLSVKEKYDLSDDQYRNLKLNMQNKNISSPTEEQLEQLVNEVKNDPNDDKKSELNLYGYILVAFAVIAFLVSLFLIFFRGQRRYS
jgi:hypothetical protein